MRILSHTTMRYINWKVYAQWQLDHPLIWLVVCCSRNITANYIFFGVDFPWAKMVLLQSHLHGIEITFLLHYSLVSTP